MPTRDELRNRRRRIIWNSDGDDLMATACYHSPGAEFTKGPFAAYYTIYPKRFESVDQFLRIRMKGKVEGTQASSIFYQGFTVRPNWEFPSENTKVLGPDPLRQVVDYAHANGLEFFYSIRMNDIHRTVHQGEHYWADFAVANPHLLQAELDREFFDTKVMPWARGQTDRHPLADAFDAGGKYFFLYPGAKPGDARTWGAYNWERREVRDYFLGVVQEACRRYDLDGIEFDWSRTPPFFKTQSRANAPVMTDLLRQARRWLDHWGAQRGRPMLLAAKVPDWPNESLNLGLDTKTWLKDGLLDILITGFGAKTFTIPIGEWARLGHAHGVPVYGCIENGLPGQAKSEVVRATAQRYLTEGADGVALYDHHFEPEPDALLPAWWPRGTIPEILHNIGELATLRGLDKTYVVDMYGTDVPLPRRLSTESGPCTATIPLVIHEDTPAAMSLALEVQWEPGLDVARTSLRLNGEPVARGEPFIQPNEGDNQGWYRHPVKRLRQGGNVLEMTAQPSPSGGDKLLLKQVRAAIRYH